MDDHPSYTALASLLEKYPRAAGALFQTYNDLVLAQEWVDVELVDVPACARAAIKGKQPKTDPLLYVVPCSLTESLSLSWLTAAFVALHEPPHVFLAINSADASVVYYKISRGIVKPPM